MCYVSTDTSSCAGPRTNVRVMFPTVLSFSYCVSSAQFPSVFIQYTHNWALLCILDSVVDVIEAYVLYQQVYLQDLFGVILLFQSPWPLFIANLCNFSF
jgi:hypothetical protein